MSEPSPAPRSMRTRILLALGVLIVAAAIVISLIVSWSGGSSHYSVQDGTITIESAQVGSLGAVLTTDQGYALYMFPPDEQAQVTCTDRCAVNWPPLAVPDGVQVVAGAGIDEALLGTTVGPEGARVATYDGWPLYTYSGDVQPGTASGQGQYLDGGYWYVLRPDGEVVRPAEP